MRGKIYISKTKKYLESKSCHNQVYSTLYIWIELTSRVRVKNYCNDERFFINQQWPTFRVLDKSHKYSQLLVKPNFHQKLKEKLIWEKT